MEVFRFSKFGLLRLDGIQHLQEKKAAIQEELVPTVIQPQRWRWSCIRRLFAPLELGASGSGALASDMSIDKEAKPKLSLAERYILGVTRFQFGMQRPVFGHPTHFPSSSPRSPARPLSLYMALQTKTVSAYKIKQNPVPLIVPKYSFTGVDW